jgi:DNA-binding beta-propeller fold protein YncE
MTTIPRTFVLAIGAMIVCTLSLSAQSKVRIIQTNSAGDNVHIIDPVTNKVVGEIKGIEAGHGAGASPDGTRIYCRRPGRWTSISASGR